MQPQVYSVAVILHILMREQRDEVLGGGGGRMRNCNEMEENVRRYRPVKGCSCVLSMKLYKALCSPLAKPKSPFFAFTKKDTLA
jgi:hypothetical protein